MNIDDAQIVAATGEILAQGSFAFHGDGAVAFQQAHSPLVGVRIGEGRHATAFALYDSPTRDADGLWSVGRPLHSIAFERSVAPLSALLDYPSFTGSAGAGSCDRTSIDMRAENGALAWVVVNAGEGVIDGLPPILGRAEAVRISAERDAHAITVRIGCDVPAPKRGEASLPPLHLELSARLPFAALALAGSPLWWVGGAERWSVPLAEQTGLLAQHMTLDPAGGMPLFRGHLDFGGPDRLQKPKPWIAARIADHDLLLSPVERPASDRGFVTWPRGGPQISFNALGSAVWKQMLGNRDQAAFALSGAGIGHLDGVTGKDAGEMGPHRQDITALQGQLTRSEAGLHIAFRGTLGPLNQEPVTSPLGPEFQGDFMIPAVFLFARRMALASHWPERQRLLGKT